MKLTEKQKIIIRLIGDDRFTEQVCEKYWKESATSMGTGNADFTFYTTQIKEVNAFMRAVTGIEAILEDREKEKKADDT